MPSRNPIRHHAKIPATPLPVVAGQLKSERRIALIRARLRRLALLTATKALRASIRISPSPSSL